MSAGVALLFTPTIAGTGCCEVLLSVCDQAVRAAITTLSPSMASLGNRQHDTRIGSAVIHHYGTTIVSRGWSFTFCARFLPLTTSL